MGTVRRWLALVTALTTSVLVGCAGPSPAEEHAAAPPGVASAVRADQSRDLSRHRPAIFGRHIVVAYYGTAGTGSLGVLGEASPGAITSRLRAAARPYRHGGRRVRIAYELIVTIADRDPGDDGSYSHDVARQAVQRYVKAARRHHALLVLDLQPGRSTFPAVAKRWAWALRRPYVGLALDPEWRMRPGEVPGETIGSVSAREVNKTSAWLAGLARRRDLPRKLFLVHQFRTDMVRHIGRVKDRTVLVEVQHADGFGTQAQKLATYHNVERHRRFHMGFKLFYDEDSDLFRPRQVLRLHPRVDYVSYQ